MPAGLLVLGLGLGTLTLAMLRTSPQFSTAAAVPGGPVLLLVAAWSCLLAAAARGNAGDRRTAVLVGLAGISWLVPEWETPDAPTVLYAAALVLGSVTPALVLHAVVAATDPSRRRALDTGVLALGYLVSLGLLGLAPAVVSDAESLSCSDCPTNPWLVWGSSGALEVLNPVGHACATAWLLGAVAVTVRDLPMMHRPELLVFRAPAAVFLTILAGRHVDLLLRELPPRSSAARAWWLVATIALVAVAAGVLVQVWSERRTRRALARTVLDLSRGQRPGLVRAAFAERLHDDSVQLCYPSADGSYVDGEGRPVAVSAGPDRTITTLEHAGSPLGLLVHSVEMSEPVLKELVAATHLGLEHEGLTARTLVEERELRESGRRLLAARDAERRRLERDLHDGAQQRLLGIALGLQLLGRECPGPAVEEARSRLAEAIAELRTMAQGLAPPVLVDAGVPAALSALAESRPLVVDRLALPRLDAVMESTVYQLVDEATRDGPATVGGAVEAGVLRIVLSLDGPTPDLTESTDRVLTLGGGMRVCPRAGGVVVEAELPVDLPPAATWGSGVLAEPDRLQPTPGVDRRGHRDHHQQDQAGTEPDRRVDPEHRGVVAEHSLHDRE